MAKASVGRRPTPKACRRAKSRGREGGDSRGKRVGESIPDGWRPEASPPAGRSCRPPPSTGRESERGRLNKSKEPQTGSGSIDCYTRRSNKGLQLFIIFIIKEGSLARMGAVSQ